MTIIPTVLQAIAPVFLLALVGFVWVRAGYEYRTEFITRLAMTLTVPSLIFVALMYSHVSLVALTTISLAALVG